MIIKYQTEKQIAISIALIVELGFLWIFPIYVAAAYVVGLIGISLYLSYYELRDEENGILEDFEPEIEIEPVLNLRGAAKAIKIEGNSKVIEFNRNKDSWRLAMITTSQKKTVTDPIHAELRGDTLPLEIEVKENRQEFEGIELGTGDAFDLIEGLVESKTGVFNFQNIYKKCLSEYSSPKPPLPCLPSK